MGERARVRVVVADDEPIARATLRKLLSADDEVELVAECANGREAVVAVRVHAPDVLVLDVQMPGRNGFDVLAELCDELPVVLFATAYDRYAIQAFDVNAVDYLLKPFDDERFRVALERAKERVRSESAEQRVASRAALLRERDGDSVAEASGRLRRLAIHRSGHIELVDVDDIHWIEAADQYVQVHTASGAHLMRESMGRLERGLDPARFLRVHRSAIVALARVRRLESGAGGARLWLGGDTWIPISRTRLATLRARLGA